MPLAGLISRARYAGSILLGRERWRPPHAVAGNHSRASDGLVYGIDRFSCFQNVVRISGWAFRPGRTIRSVELRSASGNRYRLTEIGRKSDDVAAIHGAVAAGCRFDETLIIAETVEDIASATLIVAFDQGEDSVIANLGVNPDDAAQALYPKFLDLLKERGSGELLEVGSRARSGNTRRDDVPANWGYTGMDVMEGPNVDVVGDAHNLVKAFPNRKFDAVMAFSVLEHLLMPWRFAIELNKVLNVGAIGVFTTHQTWAMHDEPWDFWRFSDTAWAALFNKATGFELIETALGEPMFIVPRRLHPITAFGETAPAWGMSSVMFRKVAETTLEWPVELNEAIETAYPV